jgi:hypothetical protein
VLVETGDGQQRAIFEDGLGSLRLFTSFSHSEFPQAFKGSPSRATAQNRIVIDLVATKKGMVGPRIYRTMQIKILIFNRVNDVW